MNFKWGDHINWGEGGCIDDDQMTRERGDGVKSLTKWWGNKRIDQCSNFRPPDTGGIKALVEFKHGQGIRFSEGIEVKFICIKYKKIFSPLHSLRACAGLNQLEINKLTDNDTRDPIFL